MGPFGEHLPGNVAGMNVGTLTRRRIGLNGSSDSQLPLLRVVQVPRRHAYVQNIRAVDGSDRVSHVRLDPAGPDGPSFPALRLDAGWIDEHANRFDLFHVNFGFDGHSPDELDAACDALRRNRKALVYTVHDLRNPHHHDRSILDSQFDVLSRRAGKIVTLTPGAAKEIEARCGRPAEVIPHPHVVPLQEIAGLRALRESRRPFILGLHLKSLRANFDAAGVLAVLEDVLPRLAGDVRLVVNIHREAYDPDGAEYDPFLRRRLDCLAAQRLISLDVHDYFSEAAFFEYLARLDVSLLPYSFGTHSGWLEACRDVGTAVVVPSAGYYVEQGDHVHAIEGRPENFDPDLLCEALESAIRAVTRRGESDLVAERRAQRHQISRRYRAVYEQALGHRY